jgi:hypothetical protein
MRLLGSGVEATEAAEVTSKLVMLKPTSELVPLVRSKVPKVFENPASVNNPEPVITRSPADAQPMHSVTGPSIVNVIGEPDPVVTSKTSVPAAAAYAKPVIVTGPEAPVKEPLPPSTIPGPENVMEVAL